MSKNKPGPKTITRFHRKVLPKLGGHARAAALTPERRSEISRRGAYARAQKIRLAKLEEGGPKP